MIRVALGGLLALAALVFVWQRLLHEAVPEALAPVARVTTLDLEELRRELPRAEALALDAARVAEERLGVALGFEAPEPLAPDPEPATPPAMAPPSPDPTSPDEAVDAALIRRMLAIYDRTAWLE